MRWASLLLLLLSVAPCEATVLFFAGAETGDLSEFGTKLGAGSCGVDGTTFKTGAYSVSCTPSSVQLPTLNTFSETTIFARFYWRYTGTPGGDQALFFFSNAAHTKTIHLCFKQSNSHLFWGHSNCTLIAEGTTALSVDTWYLVEIKGVVSATVGGAEVKVNGNTEFTSLGTDTSDIIAITAGWFGPAQAGNTLTQFHDDIMLCNTAYCPAGNNIARQGKAGTPTYDAWTKNSCTGGTIDGCWSDTPFSATKNASTTTASAAQTMLVSPFSATQSGHGTETIAANSTINACKTAAIAKMATASSFSLRRRIAGSDTDTSVTLTTSDAYYDDGIWTTTAANLSAAEIGGVHGSGSNTMTVEDMWLICDYSGGSPGIKHKVIMR